MSFPDADSMTDLGSEESNNAPTEKKRLPFCRMNISFLIIDVSEYWQMRMMMPAGLPGSTCSDCGGIVGPEVGDHVSCECDTVMAMKYLHTMWWRIDFMFTDLYDVVYEYVVSMDVDHYFTRVTFEFDKHPGLGKIIADRVAEKLGLEVLSSLPDEYK